MSDIKTKGERKLIWGFKDGLGALTEALDEGWVFDPWLNSGGRPIIIGGDEPVPYWVLVKGSPEQIAELNPFIELPSEDPESEPLGYVGLRTDYIPYGSDGKPMREPDPGYVILDKGHIFAKGTVYTLLPSKKEEKSVTTP